MRTGNKLILAALAAMALLMAMGAASASASRIAAESYPAALLGASTTSSTFTLNGLTTSCGSSSLSVTLSGVGAPVSAAPTFGNCTYYAGPIVVSANGCKYDFNVGAETAPGQFEGTLGIGPAGCAITLTASGCKQTIPAQSARGTVTYSNSGTGSNTRILISADVSGLAYTSEGANCYKNAPGSTGQLQANWSVGAQNGAGNAQAAFVESHDGLFLTGSKGNVADPPRLSAEVLPASIAGEQSSTSRHKFTTATGPSVECKTATFSGSLATASSQFSLTPGFGGCTMSLYGFELSASVNANGCVYDYSVTGSSPYSGAVALNCPSGKALEAFAPGCTLKIPAQTLGTATYANSIGQTGRSVTISASGSKLSYSTSGSSCGTGSASNMTYSGGTILR
jgi:hypothetical protein